MDELGLEVMRKARTDSRTRGRGPAGDAATLAIHPELAQFDTPFAGWLQPRRCVTFCRSPCSHAGPCRAGRAGVQHGPNGSSSLVFTSIHGSPRLEADHHARCATGLAMRAPRGWPCLRCLAVAASPGFGTGLRATPTLRRRRSANCRVSSQGRRYAPRGAPFGAPVAHEVLCHGLSAIGGIAPASGETAVLKSRPTSARCCFV